jgi:hypothetical protein
MIYLEPEGEPEIDGQAYVQRFKSNGVDIDKIRQFSIQRNDQKFLSREGVERWRETKSWWPIKATKLSAVECKVEFEAAVHAWGLLWVCRYGHQRRYRHHHRRKVRLSRPFRHSKYQPHRLHPPSWRDQPRRELSCSVKTGTKWSGEWVRAYGAENRRVKKGSVR